MGHRKASTDDVDSIIDDGGMWFLKGALDTDHLGVTILELPAGGQGMPHDEADSGQEEVYVCVDGEVSFDVDGETVALGPREALRVDAATERVVRNEGDVPAELVIVGAPTSAD